MTGLLVTAILFPLAGFAGGRRTLAEAFLFGAGLLGAAMFVLGVLHLSFVVTAGLVIAAGIAGLLGHSAAPRAGNPATEQPGNRYSRVLLTALAVIPLVLLAFSAAIVPLNDFDGRAFWLLKAKALATERAIAGPFFHNEVVDDPRNQYPLLMPADAAAVMIATGDTDDRQVRWLYLLMFAALVFVVRRRLGPWYAAILAWLPQFAVVAEGGALSGYSDIAVAAFVTCAFFELLDGRSPMRFGMWLSFLLLTKNEGLPIAVILLVAGACSFRRRVALSMIAPAMAAVALFTWRSGIPRTDEENYATLLRTLPSHLTRFVPAVAESAKHLFVMSRWGLAGIAAMIALVILAWRGDWRAPAIVVSIGALYIGAYMVTQWKMSELIGVSADRLLMHMIGPALYAIAVVIDGNGRSRYTLPGYPLRSA